MSEVEMKQQLDNANNMLKVANAKLSASNHSLGVALAESNDVKAANILYQEREKELMSKAQELEFKNQCLESKLVEVEKENADLRKQLAELKQTPATPEEPAHTDHLEL